MNYEKISEHILAELECSLEELESLENREQLERQGIDVQNEIERYSALIDSFKLMVEKAKAFDEIKVYVQSAEDKLCDEEYFNEDVYEEYYGIIETVIDYYSESEKW